MADAQDVAIAPDAELQIHALLRDDYGVASARVLMATEEASPATAPSSDVAMSVVHEEAFPPAAGVKEARNFTFVLNVRPEARRPGNSIKVRIEATDNRGDLTGRSEIVAKFRRRPADGVDHQSSPSSSKILPPRPGRNAIISTSCAKRLTEMLQLQRSLHDVTLASPADDRGTFFESGGGPELIFAR